MIFQHSSSSSVHPHNSILHEVLVEAMRLSTLVWCFLVVTTKVVLAQEVAEPETMVGVDVFQETAESSPSPPEPIEEGSAEESPPETSEVESEETPSSPEQADDVSEEAPAQSGPFIDIFGPSLLALEMTGENSATLKEMLTNDALQGKKVVGLYFSADWCGPCRQFTPDLVNFYEKMNRRRGKKDEFEIVWISRCRDVQSYGQYFTQMKWIALPPQEAMGERGKWLGEKYAVKGIPTLVLLDEVGNVITKDARNQIPKDKAGIGFPWRNPLSTLYMTVFPKSLRHIIKSQVASVKHQVVKRIQTVLRPTPTKQAA